MSDTKTKEKEVENRDKYIADLATNIYLLNRKMGASKNPSTCINEAEEMYNELKARNLPVT